MKKPYERKSLFVLNIFYFALVIVSSLILAICYGLLKRVDSIVFSIFIFLVNVLSLIVLITKQNNIKLSQTSDSECFSMSKTKNENILNATNEINSPYQIELNESSGSCIKCLKKFLQVINVIFKILFLVFMSFLAAGSIVMSSGITK